MDHPYNILEVQYFKYCFDAATFKDCSVEEFVAAWDNEYEYIDCIHIQSPAGNFIYNSNHELLFMQLFCYVPDFNDYFVEVN